MNTLIILGTSRSGGNTAMAAERLRKALGEPSTTLLDLNDLDIGPFDYEVSNAGDQLVWLVEKMLEAQRIVFATPVYWYAMSTPMKNYFDRLTDLVLVPENRPKGRALAGRDTYLLSTGAYPELTEGFEVPFRLSSSYLAMEYREGLYVYMPDDKVLSENECKRIDAFAQRMKSQADMESVETTVP